MKLDQLRHSPCMLSIREWSSADLQTILEFFGTEVDDDFLKSLEQLWKREIAFSDVRFERAEVSGRPLLLHPVLIVGTTPMHPYVVLEIAPSESPGSAQTWVAIEVMDCNFETCPWGIQQAAEASSEQIEQFRAEPGSFIETPSELNVIF